jgi:hypothetical protein
MRANTVMESPDLVSTGATIERVTATNAAKIPLKTRIRRSIFFGSMPISLAPSSSSMTDLMARPREVRPKKMNRPAKVTSVIAEATRLPRRMGTPRISTAPPPMYRLKAFKG